MSEVYLPLFSLFTAAPFVAVTAILACYQLRRMAWRRNKRKGKSNLGFYPSTVALGMAFQFLQVFHRPSVAYVLQARQQEDADEDDDGDPETPTRQLIRQLNRQLRRIRRGEPVDRLILRL